MQQITKVFRNCTKFTAPFLRAEQSADQIEVAARSSELQQGETPIHLKPYDPSKYEITSHNLKVNNITKSQLQFHFKEKPEHMLKRIVFCIFSY